MRGAAVKAAAPWPFFDNLVSVAACPGTAGREETAGRSVAPNAFGAAGSAGVPPPIGLAGDLRAHSCARN
jgi:hypothetical protein